MRTLKGCLVQFATAIAAACIPLASVWAACPVGYTLACPPTPYGIATAPDVSIDGGGTPEVGNLTIYAHNGPWDTVDFFIDFPFNSLNQAWLYVSALSAARWHTESAAAVKVTLSNCPGEDCGDLADGCEIHGNGVSTLGLKYGFLTPSKTSAVYWSCCNSDGLAAEVDICISSHESATTQFEYTASAEPSTAEQDFVGAVTHAIGIAFGLSSTGGAHTSLSNVELKGSLERRWVTGQDIQRMRDKYGVMPGMDVRLRTFSPATGSWSAPITLLDGMARQPPSAAVGRIVSPTGGAASGALVVAFAAGVAEPLGDEVGFYTIPYDGETGAVASASASGTPCESIALDASNCKTHRSPAIAASTTQDTSWVAAWTVPRARTSSSCVGGVAVKVSTDGFGSIAPNGESTLDVCTFEAPALAYDDSTHQFVLAVVDQSGEVQLFLSPDGRSWTSAFSTGLHALNRVDIVCGPTSFAATGIGTCLLGYADGDRHPSDSELAYLPHVQTAPVFLVASWSPFAPSGVGCVILGDTDFPSPTLSTASDNSPFGADDHFVAHAGVRLAVRRKDFGLQYAVAAAVHSQLEAASGGKGSLSYITSQSSGDFLALGGHVDTGNWAYVDPEWGTEVVAGVPALVADRADRRLMVVYSVPQD